MRTLFLSAVLLFSFHAGAATSKDCDELMVWRTRLALFASNLHTSAADSVATPNIDRKIEYTTFVMAAKVLRQLAENHSCGTRLVNDDDRAATIEYSSTPNEPSKDLFTFDKMGNVVSWAEVSSQGKMIAVGLTPDGKVK